MKNIVRIGVLLSVLLSLAACGTFIGRSESSSVEGDYYKGTKGGLLLLGVSNSSGEAHGATVMCWIMVVCPVVTLASLPLDISIDTLLVPFDAFKGSDEESAHINH